MSREIAYRTLAACVRSAIEGGEYPDGRPLPTEDQLSRAHSVSRHTVRRAMQELVAEGLVYRIAGSGTFPVTKRDRYLRQVGSIEDLMALSEDTTCELLVPLERKIDVESASRLRLSSDEVMTLSLRRIHRGLPFCFTVVALPLRIGRLIEHLPEVTQPGFQSTATVIGLIDARMSGPITDTEQSVSAALASEESAAHLDVVPGEPTLRIDRLYFDRRGDAVELAISYFDPRLYSYRVKLRRHPL